MKCYTISPGGKLTKSIDPRTVGRLADDAAVTANKRAISQVHLGLEPLPIFKLKELLGRENMYSYGRVYLSSKQTPLEKAMERTKTCILVLYEHGKFYPDKSMGDQSEDVWMGQQRCLLLAREGKLALREIETGICYGIQGGKLTKDL